MYALIVDDEEYARSSLRTILTEFCPEINKMEEAANVADAVRIIRESEPDIVFLDIEMPNISGLQLPSFFKEEELTFQIIFITAFSKYAVEAFRLSAADYLLKPVSIPQLQQAMEKVKDNHKTTTELVTVLQENLEAKLIKRLVVPSTSGMEFIAVDQIRSLHAEGAYTSFNIYPDKKVMVSKNLKNFQNLETYSHFFKSHRSHIININSIKRFSQVDSVIILDDESEVPLSKRKKSAFLSLMKNLDISTFN